MACFAQTQLDLLCSAVVFQEMHEEHRRNIENTKEAEQRRAKKKRRAEQEKEPQCKIRPEAVCFSYQYRHQHCGRIFCHNIAGSNIVALWLPKSCRQQHHGCHNIAALALILLQGQDCGSHNIADGRIMAASHNPAASPNISSWSNTCHALHSEFSWYGTFSGPSVTCHLGV